MRLFSYKYYRIDTGDEGPLWKRSAILNTTTGFDMHNISNERAHFFPSIDVSNFENKKEVEKYMYITMSIYVCKEIYIYM